MESLTVAIYANYGLLVHEKEVVYTYPCSATEICDELIVELPSINGAHWYLNTYGDPCIKIGAYVYCLAQLLSAYRDCPVLRWLDDDGVMRRVALCEAM